MKLSYYFDMSDATLLSLHKLLRLFLNQDSVLKEDDVEDLLDYVLFFELLAFNFKLQVQFISKLSSSLLRLLFEKDYLQEETLLYFYHRIRDKEWFINRASYLSIDSKWTLIERCYEKEDTEELDIKAIIFEKTQKEGVEILKSPSPLHLKQSFEKALWDEAITVENFLQLYLEWWSVASHFEEELAFLLKLNLKEWPEISEKNFGVYAKLFVLMHYTVALPTAFDALKESIKQYLWQCFDASMSKRSVLQSVPEKILFFLLQELESKEKLDVQLKGYLNDLLAREAFPRLKKCVRRYTLDFTVPAEPILPEALQKALGDLLVP